MRPAMQLASSPGMRVFRDVGAMRLPMRSWNCLVISSRSDSGNAAKPG